MLDETSITILRKIFVGSTSSPTGLNAQRFRAEHHEHLELIDSLVSSGYIENRDGKYSLKLTTLPDIADSTPQVGSLLRLCEHLFNALRQAYLNNPGEQISLDELSKLTDIPKQELYAGLMYSYEASLLSGYTTLTANDAYVTPAEKLLRYKSFGLVLEEMRSWSIKPIAKQNHALIPTLNLPFFGTNETTFEQLLHPTIIEHALPKYKDGHLRNAVLDSIIAIFELIRQKTGLSEDGDKLVGKAFSLTAPYLILNEIDSESGKNEQKGFMQILTGAYQGIRNPNAHSLDNDLTPLEAAQYLVFASLLARQIEEAKVIKQ
jgi:uncharacterized protein (TIGR02391 family)